MPIPTTAQNYRKNDERIKAAMNQETHDHDSYFYSLCRPYKEWKKRKCLRCPSTFMSKGPHNRLCGGCNGTIKKGKFA